LALPPVGARRFFGLVVPLDGLPVEDFLTAVAAAPASVKVTVGNRFPVVLPEEPAAHELPGVHICLTTSTVASRV
jgi:hypothetical protein